MLKIFKIVAVLTLVFGITILNSSCSKRKNPTQLTVLHGLEYESSFNDTASFWFNYMGNNTFRELSVYTPPGYDPSDTTTKYPVLYLLHGFGGDQDYFTDLFGLNSIADEMISKGEIKPMIIATIDASSELGGGWYCDTDSFGVEENVIDTLYFNYTGFDEEGNPIESTAVTDTNDVVRYFGGLYENLIVEQLRREIKQDYNIYTDVSHTGIGGHSMGGYGAMKIGMKHTDIYGSISSMSGPLAFDSLIGLIPYVLAENGLSADSSDTYNEALFHNMLPSQSKKLTTMMISMGASFSPFHFDDTDSSYWVGLPITIKEDNNLIQLSINLPFNWTFFTNPTLDATIWSKWLAQDCYTLLDTYASNLIANNTAIYMDCGDNDELNLKAHNDAFDAKLTTLGVPHKYYVYSGYSGNPAMHSNFITQRLREVLKFHSQNFQ